MLSQLSADTGILTNIRVYFPLSSLDVFAENGTAGATLTWFSGSVTEPAPRTGVTQVLSPQNRIPERVLRVDIPWGHLTDFRGCRLGVSSGFVWGNVFGKLSLPFVYNNSCCLLHITRQMFVLDIVENVLSCIATERPTVARRVWLIYAATKIYFLPKYFTLAYSWMRVQFNFEPHKGYSIVVRQLIGWWCTEWYTVYIRDE